MNPNILNAERRLGITKPPQYLVDLLINISRRSLSELVIVH